jgi:hypothetical protein
MFQKPAKDGYLAWKGLKSAKNQKTGQIDTKAKIILAELWSRSIQALTVCINFSVWRRTSHLIAIMSDSHVTSDVFVSLHVSKLTR